MVAGNSLTHAHSRSLPHQDLFSHGCGLCKTKGGLSALLLSSEARLFGRVAVPYLSGLNGHISGRGTNGTEGAGAGDRRRGCRFECRQELAVGLSGSRACCSHWLSCIQKFHQHFSSGRPHRFQAWLLGWRPLRRAARETRWQVTRVPTEGCACLRVRACLWVLGQPALPGV